jgi:cytochrome oxidase assembly protein ShyY1
MKRFLGLTILAVVLVGICGKAALWQYDRHLKRSEYNQLIESNINRPTLLEAEISSLNESDLAWRELKLSGTFQPQTEILIRNRYHNGEYGFGVITLFNSIAGKSYWIDRGWVKAGPDAKTPPKTQEITGEPVTIIGRIHTQRIDQQVRGTFFASPIGNGESELKNWDNQNSISSESIYLDLITGLPTKFTPDVPTELPVLSDGPHLAYTFQWVIFALLVLLGYFLILREDWRERRGKR